MDILYKTLRWPVVSLLITGGVHFIVEAIWPDLKGFYSAPVIAPLVLVFGLWVGYRAIGAGGTYIHAIIAAAILGVLPIVLEIVGFGMILGHGIDEGTLSGVFASSYILFGALIGAGFVLSREGSAA